MLLLFFVFMWSQCKVIYLKRQLVNQLVIYDRNLTLSKANTFKSCWRFFCWKVNSFKSECFQTFEKLKFSALSKC